MAKEIRGIYSRGQFLEYSLRPPVKAKLNSKSTEILKWTKKGKVLHGSFRDGKLLIYSSWGDTH